MVQNYFFHVLKLLMYDYLLHHQIVKRCVAQIQLIYILKLIFLLQTIREQIRWNFNIGCEKVQKVKANNPLLFLSQILYIR